MSSLAHSKRALERSHCTTNADGKEDPSCNATTTNDNHSHVEEPLFPQPFKKVRTASSSPPSSSEQQQQQRSSGGLRRSPNKWSKEENQKLAALVSHYGEKKWKRISAEMGGQKTGAQCAQHWKRVLSPEIRKGHWDEVEEDLLLRLVVQYGSCWKKIAKKIPQRTDIQCRYQYMKAKQSREIKWETKEDESLLKKVMEMASYPNYGHFTTSPNNLDCRYDPRGASLPSTPPPPNPLPCSCNSTANQPPAGHHSLYHTHIKKEEASDEGNKENRLGKLRSSDGMKRNGNNNSGSNRDGSDGSVDGSGDGSGSEDGATSSGDSTSATSRQGHQLDTRDKAAGTAVPLERPGSAAGGAWSDRRADNMERDGANSYSQSLPHFLRHYSHNLANPALEIDLNKVVWLEIAEHMARMKLTSTLRTALECKTRFVELMGSSKNASWLEGVGYEGSGRGNGPFVPPASVPPPAAPSTSSSNGRPFPYTSATDTNINISINNTSDNGNNNITITNAHNITINITSTKATASNSRSSALGRGEGDEEAEDRIDSNSGSAGGGSGGSSGGDINHNLHSHNSGPPFHKGMQPVKHFNPLPYPHLPHPHPHQQQQGTAAGGASESFLKNPTLPSLPPFPSFPPFSSTFPHPHQRHHLHPLSTENATPARSSSSSPSFSNSNVPSASSSFMRNGNAAVATSMMMSSGLDSLAAVASTLPRSELPPPPPHAPSHHDFPPRL